MGRKTDVAEKVFQRTGPGNYGKNTSRKGEVSEDDIRILAYNIWEQDRSKAADICWFEAEARLKEK